MLQTLKNLLESKSFVVSLLSVIAAVAAVFGYNVDPTKVVAVLTPFMIIMGAAGWGESAAKHQADTQLKMHAMTLEHQAKMNASPEVKS